ncbi:MAG TPA: MerR family transcriptional regulator [Gaiellaceae bacterium]|nr:MerR family transcriptional regulator [Gaiellaceae bacterium]
MTATLNIAALTRRTGVPPDTIRKWEQRYGVLRPARTPGGQRRYTEIDVARVEWLKARISEGFRIGEAAELLGASVVASADGGELRRAIVDGTRASDLDAVTAAVEQALVVLAAETAFAEVLGPALVDIGELWARGDVTVAQEHLASSTVRAALLRLLADRRGSVRGVAVLACAPGERHEIGLLMLAVLLRANGWQVAYLGPDTPVEDAVELARELDASAILLSVTRTEPAATLEAALRELDVPARVLVGGRATRHREPAGALAALA